MASKDVAVGMGYRLNLSARGLRLGRTGTVMLVVPSLTNPHFADVHSGAARVGAEHGIGVIVYPLNDEDGTGPFPVPRQAIDGVLACAVSAGSIGLLRDGVAQVALDSDPDTGVSSVTMEVAAGMRSAVDRLVQLGHRHILHVRAARDAWTFAQRTEAFDGRIAAHGGVRGRSVAVPFDGGRTRELIRARLRGDPSVTGIICDDDNLAACAYSAVHSLGLSIPGDLSVIGFDDLPLASLLVPALTTVRLPARELGRLGMVTFLSRDTVPSRTVMPVEFVERGSVGPPKGSPTR